jgi:hypothetical protein
MGRAEVPIAGWGTDIGSAVVGVSLNLAAGFIVISVSYANVLGWGWG